MKCVFANTVELRGSCVVKDFQGGGASYIMPDSFLKEIREVKVLLESIKTFSSQLNLSKLAEAIKLKEGKIDFDPAAVIALMFAYETITWIMTAICHVPKAFERGKNMPRL